MRCVVCGRRPSEGCNDKTHQAHDRLWSGVGVGNRMSESGAWAEAEDLRARRESLALTQETVARRLGVSYSTLSRWETGQHMPLTSWQHRWREVLHSWGETA